MSEDELFDTSPVAAKRSWKRKATQQQRRNDGLIFLDELLAEDAEQHEKLSILREQTEKCRERLKERQQGIEAGAVNRSAEKRRYSASRLEIDWDYINGAESVAQDKHRCQKLVSLRNDKSNTKSRNSDDFLEVDEGSLSGPDEAFDDVVGAALPSLLCKPVWSLAPFPKDDGSTLCAVFSKLNEVEMVEALSQGYAWRYVAASGEMASPTLLAWLHEKVAMDPRTGLAEAAGATLVGLSQLERQVGLCPPQLIRHIFDAFLLGTNGEPADQAAANRVALYMHVVSSCLKHDLAADPIACLRFALIATSDRTIAATPRGRHAARRLAAAALEAAASQTICKLPNGLVPEHGQDRFTPTRAAALVVAVRTLPHSKKRPVRQLAAGVAAQILVNHVLNGSDFANVKHDISLRSQDILAGEEWILPYLYTMLAALATLEGDVGGAPSRDIILGSHERFYAALVAIDALYGQLAPDLSFQHHTHLDHAATALKRRVRSEFDPNAVRCHELLDLVSGPYILLEIE